MSSADSRMPPYAKGVNASEAAPRDDSNMSAGCT